MKMAARVVILAIIISTSIQSMSGQSSKILNNKTRVTINAYELTAQDFRKFKSIYKIEPIAGDYWYDRRSGAFGKIGGPASGVMFPNHNFGALSSSASSGHSGVYVNGRQLQQLEAVLLARLFDYSSPVKRKYWLEANGNIGMEGYPLALGNIYIAMSLHNRRAQGNDNFWSKGLYGSGNYYKGAGGQPSIGYVSVPGYGPVSHGMD